MTATARKLYHENQHLGNCDFVCIIPSCLHFTIFVKNAATRMVCVN